MSKFHKIISGIALWFFITLGAGVFGAFWEVRDVPREHVTNGTGIGMLLGGIFGLFYGAIAASFAVLAFQLIIARVKPAPPGNE
jgi:hypothetical protein